MRSLKLMVHLSRSWAYFWAVVFSVVMVVWCSWRVPNALSGMYGNFDGIWAAWNLKAVVDWGLPFDLSPFNPFSGLGSVLLPNLPWLNPGAIVFALPLHRDALYVLSYTAYLAELCISLFVLLRAFQVGPITSAVACQLMALVLAPPWNGYFQSLSWFSLAPVYIHLFAVFNLGLVSLLRLGRGDRRRNLFHAAAILALAFSAFYSAPITALTYVPVYGFIAIVLIAGNRPSRHEIFWKAGTLIFLVIVFWAMGFIDYLRATAAVSARAGHFPAFLWPGLELLTPQFWSDIVRSFQLCGRPEIMLCRNSTQLFAVHLAGVAGAAVEVLLRSSRLRLLAAGYLIFVAGLYFYELLGFKLVLGPLHVLSTPFYWWAAYPFLMLFAAMLVYRMAAALGWTLERAVAALSVVERGEESPAYRLGLRHGVRNLLLGFAVVAAPLAVPAYAYWVWKTGINPYLPPRQKEARGPLGYSRLRTAAPGPISSYLREHAGIAPGTLFRGYTATYHGDPKGHLATALKLDTKSDHRSTMTYIDARPVLDTRFGNQFQHMDLWDFGVPTLEDYGQWISRQDAAVYELAFTKPGDTTNPLVLHMLRPDLDLLARLGVRFLISDVALEEPRLTLRAKQGAPGFGDLLLYELAEPNLGTRSAQKFVSASSFADAVAAMKGLARDKESAVFMDGAPPRVSGRLRSSDFRFERDGFRLTADSEGASAVVLPIQFSNCWKIVEGPGGDGVKIRRADGILTMIEFSGKIDARVRLHFGPPAHSSCRFADADDYSRLSALAASK